MQNISPIKNLNVYKHPKNIFINLEILLFRM